MKKLIIFLSFVMVMGLGVYNIRAEDMTEGGTLIGAAPAKEIVDMENKTCPVSGKEVSEKNFYVYNNTRYGFCCNMCVMKFQKNPEKYLKGEGS